MTLILPSHSSSITRVAPTNNDALPQQTFLNPVALYRRNNCDEDNYNTGTQILGVGGEKGDQLSVLAVLVTVFRKSLVGCQSTSCELEEQLMEIGVPTNVRHVAHVTFDRFDGFLGLPVEFEPEVPRRPPSASTRVFGVSTESMQLSFDSRGNCVPTILLMMQRRLYSQGGLQSEGIFRINAENGQEEYVRELLNNGMIPENIDVHCLAGLIKAWFRELPRAILDSLSPEQVMLVQSEDECTHLVSLLPQTEAALLDWAINLMADVAQLEYLNKMNARNIAMVFAPNMTHMSDPVTALMYVVQVMNFLKTLVMKTLRAREDSIPDGGRALHLKPPDEDAHHGSLGRLILETDEVSDQDEQVHVGKEPLSENCNANSMSQTNPETSNSTNCFLCSVESTQTDGSDNLSANRIECEKAAFGNGRTQQKNRRTERKSNNVKKESRKPATISKELSITSRLNSRAERVESWRGQSHQKPTSGASTSCSVRAALSCCVQQVRTYDHHLYLCLLELPPYMRKAAFTLCAFNIETAKAKDVASDPRIGLMRLLWWQDAIDKIFSNRLIEHPVAQALASDLHEHKISKIWLRRSVEARINDAKRDATDIPKTVEELEKYAEDTMSITQHFKLVVLILQ